MDWEKIGRAVGRFFLAVLEYSFKLCAIVATGITIGTGGAFADKITNGFGSLTLTLHQLVEIPGKLMDMGTLIHDYNSQSAAVFTETHGIDATSHLLFTLNKGIEYLISVYENFSRSPLETATAMLLVFLTFYLLAWVLRFTRQHGRGSFLVRLERKLAEKTFDRDTPTPPSSSAPESARPAVNVKTRARLKTPVNKETRAQAVSKPKSEPQSRPPKSSNPTKPQHNDFAPNSETLSYLLESARSS